MAVNSHNTATTIGEILNHCEQRLQGSDVFFGHGTDNPWDEAVQLVLTVAQLPLDSGDDVLALPVDDATQERVKQLLVRRIEARIPLPYLLGRAWFAGLEFKCDERAIIPRSPIGELILNGFSPWYTGPSVKRVLDLCCGGGCIGLASAHYLPEACVDLVDLDSQALALAADNRTLLGLQARVNILRSNLLADLPPAQYDVVLCNPPYVDAAELGAMPREYSAEPDIALGSGADGLDATREILANIGAFLAPHGLLVLEVGHSWPALEAAYPDVPFTWVDFENGGEGVCVIGAREWQDYSASFRR